MLLVIDIGNTNIVLGIYEGEKLLAHWRLQSKAGKTQDEYGVLLVQLFRIKGIDVEAIQGVILASVVPPLVPVIQGVCENYFHIKPLMVEPGIKTGMPILYENPREVGADRIINAVAAYHQYQRPLIIVDFGTATTFDVVSGKGQYLGGLIAPGITISMDALFIKTSKLPRFELKKPKSVIGKNTIHSMQAGLLYGYVGLVDGIVERIAEEIGETPKVIATGGLAPTIAPETKTIEEINENLTLEGLRLIWEMNQK